MQQMVKGRNIEQCLKELKKLKQAADEAIDTVTNCITDKLDKAVELFSQIARTIEDIINGLNNILEQAHTCNQPGKNFFQVTRCLDQVNTQSIYMLR